MAQAVASCAGVRAQWSSVTSQLSVSRSTLAKGKEEKAEAKKAGKKAPEVSKQAKDAARKKFAAAMREVVSKQGKAYDRIVREMDRDQYREYVLSVRHAPLAGEPQAAILSDWLPICEVIVADKVAYEAQKFFRDNDMTIPETDQVPLTAGDQIEGVPAITSVLPSLGPEVAGMAFAMAGSKVKDIPMEQLEFGVEDWGSFEVAVSGLEAQAGTKAMRATAAGVLGVSIDDEPAAVKRVYRKLIATEHPDRNPDASIEKFNAIKAYDLLSDRGGQSGATFEGLGDKAKRDFVKLPGVQAGSAPLPKSAKVEVQLRSLTIYDRISNIFTARNMSLQSRLPTAAAPKPAEPMAPAEEVKAQEPEPVAA